MSTSDVTYNSIKNLYDQFRTVYLNRKYYGYRLQRIQSLDKGLEISIAIGTSSAIAGWSLWNLKVGSTIWTIYGGLIALLAIIKPFLQLSKQIERYTKLFIGYGDMYFDLELLVNEVGRTRQYSREMDISYRKTIERLKQFSADDDPQPARRLITKFMKEVNNEKPASGFWWPQKIKGE
jgi:hypothetical protein